MSIDGAKSEGLTIIGWRISTFVAREDLVRHERFVVDSADRPSHVCLSLHVTLRVRRPLRICLSVPSSVTVPPSPQSDTTPDIGGMSCDKGRVVRLI